jgi:hypothetical protein
MQTFLRDSVSEPLPGIAIVFAGRPGQLSNRHWPSQAHSPGVSLELLAREVPRRAVFGLGATNYPGRCSRAVSLSNPFWRAKDSTRDWLVAPETSTFRMLARPFNYQKHVIAGPHCASYHGPELSPWSWRSRDESHHRTLHRRGVGRIPQTQGPGQHQPEERHSRSAHSSGSSSCRSSAKCYGETCR